MGSNCCFRVGGFGLFGRLRFGIGVLQCYQDSQILGASGGSFVIDDVGHAGDEQGLGAEIDGEGTAAQRFAGADDIDTEAEIELKIVAIAGKPKYLRCGTKRVVDDESHRFGEAFPLPDVGWGFAEQEIDVYGAAALPIITASSLSWLKRLAICWRQGAASIGPWHRLL